MFLHRNENKDEDDGAQETMTGEHLPLNAFGAIMGISRSEEAGLEIEHRL